jgi:hypothetical protein
VRSAVFFCEESVFVFLLRFASSFCSLCVSVCHIHFGCVLPLAGVIFISDDSVLDFEVLASCALFLLDPCGHFETRASAIFSKHL